MVPSRLDSTVASPAVASAVTVNCLALFQSAIAKGRYSQFADFTLGVDDVDGVAAHPGASFRQPSQPSHAAWRREMLPLPDRMLSLSTNISSLCDLNPGSKL